MNEERRREKGIFSCTSKQDPQSPFELYFFFNVFVVYPYMITSIFIYIFILLFIYFVLPVTEKNALTFLLFKSVVANLL